MNPITITASHPDYALADLLTHLKSSGVESQSRNGPVVRFTAPTTIVWHNLNRVSSSAVRDANPFLHLIEAVWMLAGRNDVAPMAKLAPNMSSYSDDGQTLNGAYGYRWRKHFGFDQISVLIKELKINPSTRRAVLIMHDADDLIYGINGGKDQCCNFAILFDVVADKLNMTVVNRSNDSVLGACGANLVHMSVLHEYVAAMTGHQVGIYYQTSNNMHLYTELNPVSTRCWSNPAAIPSVEYAPDNLHFGEMTELTDEDNVAVFNELIRDFMGEDLHYTEADSGTYSFVQIVLGMSDAFKLYKKYGAQHAHKWLTSLSVTDAGSVFCNSPWRFAAMDWLARRPSFNAEAAASNQKP